MSEEKKGLFDRVVDFFNSDKVQASKLIARALIEETTGAPSGVVADYYFLAACYGASGKSKELVDKAVSQLKEVVPNYDPNTRFTWKSTGIEGLSAGDLETKTRQFDEFKYRIRVIGEMNRFCDSHKDFSFGGALGEYFPSAKNMTIHIEEPAPTPGPTA